MNAEQPPLTTPTRFLLECSATGYPLPSVTDDPFNRCIPLTPPLPTAIHLQHSNTAEHSLHQQHQHVFAQPIFATHPTSYYPTQQPQQMMLPIKQQQRHYQPPTPPPGMPTFANQPPLTHTASVTNDTTSTVGTNNSTTMVTSTSTPIVTENSIFPPPPPLLQHPTTTTTTTTCIPSDTFHHQIELPPSPPKSTTTSRKRRVSLVQHENEEDDFEGDDEQRKKLLERNRVAASKCRQKKKKWMQDLEIRSEQVISRNEELKVLLSKLREESMFLRNQLLTHSDCNCTMVQAYLRRSSARLSLGGDMSLSTTTAADTVAELMNHHQSSPSFSSPSSSHRSSPETL
ncbi:hypothetical protein BDA99DRAFT_609124 [Phascolomyces articulosus]|uniref:BZIP domain-containing protein n=1 Tax=Phascolomyces articulosus TaxID=60185 RepID=A0AAD5JP27_9FUNG|nr:hypothetical protein BDA99DRAFT_609124 [Phascolomyces articulosus]